MPELPIRDHKHYAGIDPGFKGGICLMDAGGERLKFWPMPVRGTAGKRQEIDLDGLNGAFKHLRLMPDTAVGIEWPSTRPGEGAERSERFGRGKGYLEAFAYLKGLDYYLIVPSLWKGRLGLPGKSDPEAVKAAAGVFDLYYPRYAGDVRGPRGGIKDGLVEAALIAHFLRTRTFSGMRATVERFGKGSDEATMMLFGCGPKRKRPKNSGGII